ncbi:hypothetical protein ADK47_18885 [Streptomyces rimosus subsp. rimosus]|nr:hypothetical protein ADK78_12385 [Kitasatospora aureofaciens]KOT46366.1 hypothetical protein ADK42_00810 [Streptomyces rimosus subsp. rimosus]KOT47583.1 hypothetical protein ADK84_00805 [Streptomyces sp. NRRL WC-3701]KOT61867.1 hypothetical protein ADK44_14185 [Streptomyces rimosus subsp. rimosus]KOT63463.1 hypothetical protein ADK45_15235 [Streptomyces rimosus subsp. rimosus]
MEVGPLVVAGGGGAEAFQAVVGSLDGVAFLVALAVESGGSTAAGAAVEPVSALVTPLGDGVGDPAASQVAAVVPGRVSLVGQDMLRPGARPPDSEAGDGYLLQY